MIQVSDSVKKKMLSRIILAHNAFVDISDYAYVKGLKSILSKAEDNAERLFGLIKYLESTDERQLAENPSASDYGGTRKRLDLIHRLRKHPYVAGFMKRQLTTYHSKKRHFFKRGSVAFVSDMADGFVRLHHGTRGGIDRKNFAVLYITDLDGKFVPNHESLDIYG